MVGHVVYYIHKLIKRRGELQMTIIFLLAMIFNFTGGDVPQDLTAQDIAQVESVQVTDQGMQLNFEDQTGYYIQF